MTKHSLCSTHLQIMEAQSERRRYMFSAGLFDGCEAIYVRLNDAGDADFILDANGTTIVEVNVPGKRRIYAWTDAGTAELCEAKLTI